LILKPGIKVLLILIFIEMAMEKIDFIPFNGQASIDHLGDISFNIRSRSNETYQNFFIPEGINICILPGGGHLMPASDKPNGKTYAKKVIAAFKAADQKFFFKTSKETEDYFYLLYNAVRIAMETEVDIECKENESDEDVEEHTIFSKYIMGGDKRSNPKQRMDKMFCTLSGFITVFATDPNVIASMKDTYNGDPENLNWEDVYIVLRVAT
jgi:hypothetical protein